MNPTWLEVVLTGFTAGIGGFITKQVIANKLYVRKEMCSVLHDGLTKQLTRIEDKLDKLNGGK